ncbi:hypothetical protein ACFLYD_05415 [Chloroflexota bacterium]
MTHFRPLRYSAYDSACKNCTFLTVNPALFTRIGRIDLLKHTVTLVLAGGGQDGGD